MKSTESQQRNRRYTEKLSGTFRTENALAQIRLSGRRGKRQSSEDRNDSIWTTERK